MSKKNSNIETSKKFFVGVLGHQIKETTSMVERGKIEPNFAIAYLIRLMNMSIQGRAWGGANKIVIDSLIELHNACKAS